MRLAYLTNQYPAVSHTFIRREIQALEGVGWTVLRYALRPGKNLIDPEDLKEEKKTRYILRAGTFHILRCCIVVLLTRPLAVLRALRQTIRIGWRSDRGILRHLIYVAEAAILAEGGWCRRDAVQHVHAHFGTNSATIAMLAWQLSGVPYSFTVHGPEEFDKRAMIGLDEKIRNCVFVVAISSYGRSQLFRCAEFEHWTKVKVIRCGLESTYFDAAEAPVISSNRFVCVGRLSEQKGHILLIEAAKCLVMRGEDFELVLVGDGELRTEIEALIKRYSLQKRVRITGWVDGSRVREEILEARALILPSFAEGLPVVIMEAMAMRRPIISTFIAGIPELVIVGEHGWLVPAGDVERLTDVMQACLKASIDALRQMGEAAQRQVRLHHSVDVEARKMAILFENAIGKGILKAESV